MTTLLANDGKSSMKSQDQKLGCILAKWLTVAAFKCTERVWACSQKTCIKHTLTAPSSSCKFRTPSPCL